MISKPLMNRKEIMNDEHCLPFSIRDCSTIAFTVSLAFLWQLNTVFHSAHCALCGNACLPMLSEHWLCESSSNIDLQARSRAIVQCAWWCWVVLILHELLLVGHFHVGRKSQLVPHFCVVDHTCDEFPQQKLYVADVSINRTLGSLCVSWVRDVLHLP